MEGKENNGDLLRVSRLYKGFGAVQALHGVELNVKPGEIIALVGDNGAGKSTMIKVISGVLMPDSGSIWFNGRAVQIRSPAEAMGLGIQTVYQDLALCDNLSIVANLYLGRETRTVVIPRIWTTLQEITMVKSSTEVLSYLGINLPDPRTPVASLSGGQRQAVAVARAVLWGSKLVILDEPTAALGVVQTQMVLRLIHQLASQGIGVLVISHNLSDVFAVSDRIVVLRHGETVGNFRKEDTTTDEIVSAITGATGGVYA